MAQLMTLSSGASKALIYPGAGGRLGQLDLGGGPLLRGPSEPLDWGHWGSYPMLPWSNRIPGGHLRFGDIDAVLPVNWEDGSAIHGLTADIPWRVCAVSETAAELEIVVREGPYHVRGEQRFELADGVLEQELAVVNLAPHSVPVGLGIHPWFRFGRVRIPADALWPGEVLPTGEPPVAVAGASDLRDGVAVPPPMDRCYTQLNSKTAEVPGARLSWDGPITQVVVYTGEPGCVAVEPVTMMSNGFAFAEAGLRGHGVQVLGRGDSISVRYWFARP